MLNKLLHFLNIVLAFSSFFKVLSVLIAFVFIPTISSAQIRMNQQEYKKLISESLEYIRMGRLDEIEGIIDLLARSKQTSYDASHLANELGLAYRVANNYSKSETMLRLSLKIKENIGKKGIDYGITLDNLALTLQMLGRFDEAEKLYKKSLSVIEPIRNKYSKDYQTVLHNLALFYDETGKLDLSLQLNQKSLNLKLKSTPLDHESVATTFNSIGALWRAQEKYAEAEIAYVNAHNHAKKINDSGKGKGLTSLVLLNLGVLNAHQKKYDKALGYFKKARNILKESSSLDTYLYAFLNFNIGDIYLQKENATLALIYLTIAHETYKKIVSSEHPFVGVILSKQALGHLMLGEWWEAYSLLKQSSMIASSIRTGRLNIGGSSGERVTKYDGSIVDYISLSWSLHEKKLISDGFENSFSAMQYLETLSATKALNKMAYRSAQSNTKIKSLVRQHQDLIDKRNEIDKKLMTQLSGNSMNIDESDRSKNRRHIIEIDSKLKSIESRIKKISPHFSNISIPSSLTLNEVKELLHHEEALITYSIFDDYTYGWLVTKKHKKWFKIQKGRKWIADKVARLRLGLDPAGLTRKIVDERGFIPSQKANVKSQGLPFDLHLAYEIYQKLIGKFEPVLKGINHLIVIPSGALTSIPFQVLVTKKHGNALPGYKGYRNADWLFKRYAISVLPSVSSLKVLRKLAKNTVVAKKSYIGFGDPIFGPCRGSSKSTQSTTTIRTYSDYFVGDRADGGKLCELVQLPGTADELNTISSRLGISGSHIFLRKAASEWNIKKMSHEGRLDDYRVIHFATHGLLAGDLKNVGEPGLAFSLPAIPSEKDDGLLTASEAAQLKLNADWVILSACNTAAGDKLGAEALSGLAKAFFYAGAKSLLVSSWPVDDAAAAELTANALEYHKDYPNIGRSQALQKSMLQVMNTKNKPYFAHPSIWAPFFLVGDGSN